LVRGPTAPHKFPETMDAEEEQSFYHPPRLSYGRGPSRHSLAKDRERIQVFCQKVRDYLEKREIVCTVSYGTKRENIYANKLIIEVNGSQYRRCRDLCTAKRFKLDLTRTQGRVAIAYYVDGKWKGEERLSPSPPPPHYTLEEMAAIEKEHQLSFVTTEKVKVDACIECVKAYHQETLRGEEEEDAAEEEEAAMSVLADEMEQYLCARGVFCTVTTGVLPEETNYSKPNMILLVDEKRLEKCKEICGKKQFRLPGKLAPLHIEYVVTPGGEFVLRNLRGGRD
jgi:hypothetical protein